MAGARARSGLTQAEIAARMGTTQSAVARLESERSLPSLRTLQRFAEAVGARLVVTLEPLTVSPSEKLLADSKRRAKRRAGATSRAKTMKASSAGGEA